LSTLLDRVAALTIEIDSPDETVRVSLGRTSGVSIDFDDDIMDLHTEESLEEQIELALSAAIEEYELETSRLREEIYGPTARQANPKQLRFREMCEKIKFSTQSQTHHIAIDWSGSADIVVAISPGTFSELTQDQLSSEANTIVHAALTVYSQSVKAIQSHVYLRSPDHP